MTSYQVDDRIGIGGDLATIRYVGHIPPWGDSITALGIEWDNPNRGKNDGSINGHRYFTTQHGVSGSFIKATNKAISLPQTFVDVLRSQYGFTADFNEVNIGTKTTESYGFDKLNKITGNFSQLTSITLEKRMIKSSGDLKYFEFTNLSSLDLSFNLLTNFDNLSSIILKAPNLIQLNANGNRIQCISRRLSFQSVKSLELSTTYLKINLLFDLLSQFPNLEELNIAHNCYDDIDIDLLLKLSNLKLKLIDLSFNKLTRIPNLSVTSINILNNIISNLDLPDKFNPKLLDLRHNSITSWDECDKLIKLSKLEILRINGNPVFEAYSAEEQEIYLMARINFYGKLNGSILSKDEVSNADLYFISQVRSNKIQYSKGLRWRELLEKYQVNDIDVETTILTPLQKKFLNLNLNYNNYRFSRLFLNSNSVLKLKGIASKQWDLCVLDVKIYYLMDDIKLHLDDDISILDNYGFSQTQDIYVELNNK